MGRPATQLKTHDLAWLIQPWGDGECAAPEQMIPLVYRELKRIAHRYMAGERQGHTLQTSALVNEAYMKLVVKVSSDTVLRDWNMAKAWLARELNKDQQGAS